MPVFARQIVERLRDAGFEAYWAGGCVRDQLMGREPHDYDVATSATPQEVRRLFGFNRTLAVGMAFGVVVVLGPPEVGPVEVATFRSEWGYEDGRHPGQVAFSSAREDAQRRDFTINGLFYDPLEDHVIDFVGGQADLRAGIVRAIGDPAERFAEDKLRMLRAVRFATTLDFTLEAATQAAIGRMAREIAAVSAERIADEMERMLVAPSRAAAVGLLVETGLAAEVLPEIVVRGHLKTRGRHGVPGNERSEGPVLPTLGQRFAMAQAPDHGFETSSRAPGHQDKLQKTLRTLQQIDEATFSLVLAALLADWASPEGIREVCRRWRLPNQVTDRAEWLAVHRRALADAPTMRWSALQPILISPGIEELLCWMEAEAAVEGRTPVEVDYCRRRLAEPPGQLNPAPLVTGDDLVAHGLAPGPVFGELLARVREAQLDGLVSSKQEGLALVDRLLAAGEGGNSPQRHGDTGKDEG